MGVSAECVRFLGRVSIPFREVAELDFIVLSAATEISWGTCSLKHAIYNASPQDLEIAPGVRIDPIGMGLTPCCLRWHEIGLEMRGRTRLP